MSPSEASSETLARLAAPAQGLSYVVGKVELFAYLQASQLANGTSGFDLAAFHASLEENGNLPFALQAHSAGLALGPRRIDPGFVNLHSKYDGVGQEELPGVLSDPTRVRSLPGVPSGNASPLFSGYIDVAEQDRSIYYLLAKSTRVDEGEEDRVPMIVWLQGGNGCSSLIGALTENGPYLAPDSESDETLRENPGSLHRLAHTLYLDRPAGSGYSYSRYAPNVTWANDNQTAWDSVEALRGIMERRP